MIKVLVLIHFPRRCSFVGLLIILSGIPNAFLPLSPITGPVTFAAWLVYVMAANWRVEQAAEREEDSGIDDDPTWAEGLGLGG